jgi:hypothetical protein
MQKRKLLTLIIGWVIILMLSACNQTVDLSNWENFTIEGAPGFDIQFSIPPEWKTNYILPMELAIGQWKVILTPPRCSLEQSADYAEECIDMMAYIKGEAEFEEDEVLALISQNISLSDETDAESILIGQTSFDVNGLTIRRYNHKISTDAGDMQMSIYYFQTDNANYTIMTHFPYDEREGEVAEQFQSVLESIQVIK